MFRSLVCGLILLLLGVPAASAADYATDYASCLNNCRGIDGGSESSRYYRSCVDACGKRHATPEVTEGSARPTYGQPGGATPEAALRETRNAFVDLVVSDALAILATTQMFSPEAFYQRAERDMERLTDWADTLVTERYDALGTSGYFAPSVVFYPGYSKQPPPTPAALTQSLGATQSPADKERRLQAGKYAEIVQLLVDKYLLNLRESMITLTGAEPIAGVYLRDDADNLYRYEEDES